MSLLRKRRREASETEREREISNKKGRKRIFVRYTKHALVRSMETGSVYASCSHYAGERAHEHMSCEGGSDDEALNAAEGEINCFNI